ncbi:MAG: erythromycin esterase family protein [Kiritimatiellia bacterium]
MKQILILCVSIVVALPVVGGQAGSLVDALRARAFPLVDAAGLDPLVERAASRQLVLLGESTHGTSEFYRWRAKISQRLIAEQGFRFVAVEGDWAAIYRLNRYVKGLPGAEPDARAIMASFDRWPQWMWANEEFLAFVEWLRAWNVQQEPDQRAGVYGIDVYGDETVLEKLLVKLRRVDADLAAEVTRLYEPFRAFAGDGRAYAMHLLHGGASFEAGAASGLVFLQERLPQLGPMDPHRTLNILHSARVIVNAERHYRANVDRRIHGWNARADHFYQTAETLLLHYGEGAQGIVWAHNTHIGDARATRMSGDGSRNIGQAAREVLGRDQVLAVGFGTDRGAVVAGREWGTEREIMQIPSGGSGSLEAAMRVLSMPQVMFLLDDASADPVLLQMVGHRAIGVIYHPEREFPGNYVPTRFGQRYDAFLFFTETSALKVIE